MYILVTRETGANRLKTYKRVNNVSKMYCCVSHEAPFGVVLQNQIKSVARLLEQFNIYVYT